MRVVLFNINWFDPKALVIGFVTWSKVSHAGLLFKGEYKLYDASESRGFVDYNQHIRKWGKRKITVYEVPEDEAAAKKYALGKRLCKYDWKTIFAWLPFLRSNDPQTVYCFELVLQTLLTFDKINGLSVDKIGADLRAKEFRTPIDSDDIFILLERAQLNPVYQGIAAEYA